MDKLELEGSKAELTADIVTIALNGIPWVGGIVSSTASFFLQRVKNERLNKFLIRLSEDVSSLQMEVNQEYIHRDDFRDMVEDVFTKASETRQQEKLDALRSIFLSAITSENPQYEEIEEITNLVKSWQSSHIILLRILNNPELANNAAGNPVQEHRGIPTSLLASLKLLLPDWTEEKIDRSWQKLYTDGIHLTPSIKSMIGDTGIHQLENRLTPFGKKVVQYLIHTMS